MDHWISEWSGVDTPNTFMTTRATAVLKKNIRDGGSTAQLLILFTLLTPFNTVFTVYTIKTALHCLNSSIYDDQCKGLSVKEIV